MPIEWKDEQVNDHGSGITDLVTASDSSFQEICRNLGHNSKLHLLSSRDGYTRVISNQETTYKIQHLFQLEDYLIAYCHADLASGAAITTSGLFYRLESDTSSAWTQVQMPKTRSATLFTLYDSTGKGVTLRDPTGTYDQIVFQAGTDAGTDPDAAASGSTITITVDTAQLNSTTFKYNTGSGNLTWAWFNAAPFTTTFGLTVSTLSNTLSTDEIRFDELLTVQTEASAELSIYPANVRADGDGTAIVFAAEQGHLQGSEWQAHLFLALEPYIKTYTANTSDPFGEDPEAYPPTNQRVPLRKVYPVVTPGTTSTTVLKAQSAQLPKTYLGLCTDETASFTSTKDHYRYQVFTIQFVYNAAAHASDTSASVEIWCERTWGYQGTTSSGVYLDMGYTVTDENPIDPDMPYALVCPGTRPAYAGTKWSSVATPSWGHLLLVAHKSNDPFLTYEQAVAGLEAAFAEYQTRSFNVGGTVYNPSYASFGYYIRPNPNARQGATVENYYTTVAAPVVSVRYADALPDDVGNHTYGYALYLRDRYKAMVEGSPREFLINGPATFLTVRTLSPITSDVRRGYDADPAGAANEFTYSSAPRVFGAISAMITRSTSLFYQSGLEAVFARTLDGGDTYYVDDVKKFWYRTGSTPADVVPTNLTTGEAWSSKTSYIMIQESETTDDDIQAEEEAYFNGGVLSYDSLPQGPFYFDVNNQVGVFGHSVQNIHRAYVSPPGAPYASPQTVFEDFDDEISGVTHVLDKSIITTGNKIWRVEGAKGADGSGRTFLRTVSDVHGCIANQSIVRTDLGLFMWSKSGIVWTDGMRAMRVTDHLMTTYAGWLSDVRSSPTELGPKQLRGRFHEAERRVYWSLHDSDDKPFFVVLSLHKGVSPMMPVTIDTGVRYKATNTTTGVVTSTDYFETHATLYSPDTRTWYRSQDKYLMKQDAARTYDESHVTGLKHPIEVYYKSVAFSYGIPWMRKQTSKILLLLRDTTGNGVSLTPLHWNDLSTTSHSLTNCLNYQHMEFDLDYASTSKLDLEQFFKHTDCRWNSDTVVTYKRHFGRGAQRNSFKQVGFTSMKLKYGEITPETSGVTSISVTHKSGWPQSTAVVEVKSTAPGTVVTDMSLDASGQFYLTFNDSMKPVPVSTVTNVGTTGGITTYRIIALLDGENMSTGSDLVEKWNTISFYRLFTDQKIDLLGYNVTFRVIGDRTRGGLKSTDHGGVDA